MEATKPKVTISIMLAVEDTPKAVEWYEKALGARLLWSLGSVAGLEVDGAPFFLHEPVKNHFQNPKAIGATTARVELFVDEPDEVVARAVKAGATGGEIQDHVAPWGTHRQGGFVDPFGHNWLVGDKSPLNRFRLVYVTQWCSVENAVEFHQSHYTRRERLQLQFQLNGEYWTEKVGF